jgi:steroid delta-isomerase-like uncharacterized protein
MVAPQNADVVSRLIQAWNTGSVGDLAQLLAPDITVHYPAMPKPMHGLQEYQAYIRWLHKTFGDLEISIEESIAAGDNVVVRWSQRCVHQAKFLGLPATGKPISWTGITIFRLHDVRVIEERGEEDLLGVMWQLGAIPRPGQKAT